MFLLDDVSIIGRVRQPKNIPLCEEEPFITYTSYQRSWAAVCRRSKNSLITMFVCGTRKEIAATVGIASAYGNADSLN